MPDTVFHFSFLFGVVHGREEHHLLVAVYDTNIATANPNPNLTNQCTGLVLCVSYAVCVTHSDE